MGKQWTLCPTGRLFWKKNHSNDALFQLLIGKWFCFIVLHLGNFVCLCFKTVFGWNVYFLIVQCNTLMKNVSFRFVSNVCLFVCCLCRSEMCQSFHHWRFINHFPHIQKFCPLLFGRWHCKVNAQRLKFWIWFSKWRKLRRLIPKWKAYFICNWR